MFYFLPFPSNYTKCQCFNCCNFILGILDYFSIILNLLAHSFFSVLLSFVEVVYPHFPQSLGTRLFFLFKLSRFSFDQALNLASELLSNS
jgi:hypothetical protein